MEELNEAPRWMPESEIVSRPAEEPRENQSQDSRATAPPETAPQETESRVSQPQLSAPAPEPEEDFSPWRQEVAARLNRYQSRRKPRPPRYPSLRLRFETEPTMRDAEAPDLGSVSPPTSPRFADYGASNRALALNSYDFAPLSATEVSLPQLLESEDAPCGPAPVTARIIEFPRSWTPPPPALDELAEPVIVGPRILEVPQAIPPAPALGGITIEPVPQLELEKRPGIDIPLQAAPFERRVFSAAIDGVLIAAHCALFAFIFWKLTAIRPPGLQIIGVLAGLAAVLWAAYQYLLLVYAGTTPGLILAKLKIVRFDGSPAPRKLRRWRVLASFLSALSLGMGYAWVFLDEDALCWHDRITHTYLESKTQ